MSYDPTGLFDTDSLAEYLGVSRSTILSWRYQKRGPDYVRVGHRTVRYPAAWVRKWLEENRRDTTRSPRSQLRLV
ncbi:helix-turn-helix domain-containing protein [Mycobacterium sp. Y57]|uniref:helix-turn-helix transcriptional regulator n=1 Tax=Mycolicibacterium xanthum TaxID=2796469 RepID=UPI001C843A4A|nr:helix-turn-helix domain-containing protein [Mycolicibacterium xanthum]